MCSGLDASGRHCPRNLPPKSTVYDYLDLWNWDGTQERIHHALYVAVREQAGREASPTTAIIDSQSAKGALGSILRATKRQKEVDAMGLLWSAVVHPEMSGTVTAPSS